jgi:tryptophanyl-tRNA synthetase
MRVLSGIQPSGELHIGNYFGMMKHMIRYQETADLFVFIVNYHAMTSLDDGEFLRRNTLRAAMDWLALGLDPDRCTFYVQSDVPEVTELTWILSTVTPMGLLERCHSYKDKMAKGISPNHGLFAYPVLMAADILLYQANIIPVGRDQVQHVEVTRDIAIKFNNTFGDTFVLPDSEVDSNVAVVPGLDGQKMSKSYGNTLEIFLPKGQLKKKVMRIVTDSTPVEEPKNPDTCNLYALCKLFYTPDEMKALRERYLKPGLKYSDVKKELANRIFEYFAPFRERREEMEKNPEYVRKVLREGAEKARAVAAPTLEIVRERTGLSY